MEPFGFEPGPSRAMATFKEHEDGYHRCSVSINRAINGIQLNSLVEAVGATSLPNFLQEANQHVSTYTITWPRVSRLGACSTGAVVFLLEFCAFACAPNSSPSKLLSFSFISPGRTTLVRGFIAV